MNADPAAQLRLLDVQSADTELAQLAHRRSTLPQIAAIAGCTQRIDGLDLEAVDLRTSGADVGLDQRRLENEVDTVRARAARDEQRLTTGGLPAKDLAGLQHEVVTLARRQSNLEDDLLEVMEQRENIDADLAAVSARREAAEAERAQLVAERDAAFADIDQVAARRVAERAALAGELPPELLALYDKVRAANGGVGAAMLRSRRCEGCRIDLAGSELSAMRTSAPDQVMRCENCRRILVRTSESGL